MLHRKKTVARANGPPPTQDELAKQYWKSILRQLPNEKPLKLVLESIPTCKHLCNEVPRSGFIFNLLRLKLDITPKELRVMLVEGSKSP